MPIIRHFLSWDVVGRNQAFIKSSYINHIEWNQQKQLPHIIIFYFKSSTCAESKGVIINATPLAHKMGIFFNEEVCQLQQLEAWRTYVYFFYSSPPNKSRRTERVL